MGVVEMKLVNMVTEMKVLSVARLLTMKGLTDAERCAMARKVTGRNFMSRAELIRFVESHAEKIKITLPSEDVDVAA